MKRILVLDPFTNGHEAALEFIRRRGWATSECEIVFCGSHTALLARLVEGPSYAVVPVRNSIRGDVKDVVPELERLRGKGYQLAELDRLEQAIHHCLMAPKGVALGDIVHVMSKDQALGQCEKYLDDLGILPGNRHDKNSTAGAAKAISRMAPGAPYAAIASKNAAEAYGLDILASDIQDCQDNRTQFVLLEYVCEVRPVKVGIIGIGGRFGTALAAFFKRIGCEVFGSDPIYPESSNEAVAKDADVIIFAVPIKETELIIEALLSVIREDQLLLDITSVKTPAVQAMMSSKAQVCGLHPMFAPEVSFDGQTIVVCPERLTDPRWQTWVMNVLAMTGSRLKWSNPVEHDAYMVTVQVSPQFATFVNALLVMDMNVSVTESLTFTSPFYRLQFAQMGRLLSQDPDLYSAIFMKNPATVGMIERRIEVEKKLLEMIKAYDREGFRTLFKKTREHFSREVCREANELFVRIIALTRTLGQKNSVTLEFSKRDDKPGLLMKILAVFQQYDVNLTGINFTSFDAQHMQFAVSFDTPRSSEHVRLALDHIETWTGPKIKVIDD